MDGPIHAKSMSCQPCASDSSQTFSHEGTIGTSIVTKVALQYHLGKYLWPEFEGHQVWENATLTKLLERVPSANANGNRF